MIKSELPLYLITYLSKQPLFSELQIDINGYLLIYNHSSRHDEESYKKISLTRFKLPNNTVYSTTRRLIDCETMFIPCLEAINLLSTQLPASKTKHNRITSYLASIVKFTEYLWINDIYELSQVNAQTTRSLLEKLVVGGWQLSLNINKRLIEKLYLIETSEHPLFCSTNSNVSVNQTEFQKLISTNISSNEVAPYHSPITAFKDSLIKKIDAKNTCHKQIITSAMNYSLLRQTLEAINLLFYISSTHKLNFLPYPNYVRTAKKNTAPPGRTENIDGEQAGVMLEQALLLLYKHSSALLDLLDTSKQCINTVDAHKKIGTFVSSSLLDSNIKNIYSFQNYQTTIRSLNHIIRDILTSCFLIIATFNARRKDEVSHKKLGVHRGCCKVFNQELQLYEMNIYIEKTVKDYVPFYVGHATYAAILLLEKLQSLLNGEPWRNILISNVPDKFETLFRFKRFGANGVKILSEFSFETYPRGMSHHFMAKFCNFIEPPRCTPHMYRRLYCTIYLNQHEYPHLPALSQQLRHEGLDATQIYITEPSIQSAAGKIGKQYDWKVVNIAHDYHQTEITKDLKLAASEKFAELIYDIVNGVPMSGGYPKLVKIIYRRLQRFAKFLELEPSKKISTLTVQLQNRGYAPTPFRHSNCLVGDTKVPSRSKCFEPSDNLIHKERAAPLLCCNCPFSCTSSRHLENLLQDEIILSTEIESLHHDTLEHSHKVKELNNLQQTIKLHYITLKGR